MNQECRHNSLLLHLIGKANAAYFLTRIFPQSQEDEKQQIVQQFRKGPLYGEISLIRRAWNDLHLHEKVYPLPHVHLPVHVFPVHDQDSGQGFMIPLAVTAAGDWQVSDAFGTFGNLLAERTPLDSLMGLLALVEQAWEQSYNHVLPLRWSGQYNLKLLLPTHIDLYEGESLHVPLLLALLRLFASVGNGGERQLPFGQAPVFASGKLEHDGSFSPVMNITEKLQGFVREYGPGRVALLTRSQYNELAGEKALLAQVQARTAETIRDLLKLPELQGGLRLLANSYRPASNEGLIRLSISLSRKADFAQVQRLSTWVLEQVPSPYYRFQFLCDLALVYFHKGQFAEARERVLASRQLYEEYGDYFGIDDLVFLITAAGDLAIDSLEPGLIAGLVQNISDKSIALMSGKAKVKYWGILCQYHTMFGNHEQAIELGIKAVATADNTYASTAARSRNYLVHAVIVGARERSKKALSLFSEAEEWLRQSMEEWSPQDNAEAQAIHFGFCLPLQAELARLAGRPFSRNDSARRKGAWSHPWMFALLSCFRNPCNSRMERESCLAELLLVSHDAAEMHGQKSLFGLFASAYVLLSAVYYDQSIEAAVAGMQQWLNERADAGFSGWRDYLKPLLSNTISMAQAENICDAIRYH